MTVGTAVMRVDILTLFPEMFGPVLGESILRIGQEKGLLEFQVHDLRSFGDGARRNVDDRPYGGGPGMVMTCGPVFRAVEAIEDAAGGRAHRVMTTPQGRVLTDAVARELAGRERLLLVCGHYEGYDERIPMGLEADEISIGDYVLTGGELPAMVIADAVARLVPGVVGDEESVRRDSFADGMLGCPQYTRPVAFRGMNVPDVLVSGHHERVAAWRAEQVRLRTATRRPDLMMRHGDVGARRTPGEEGMAENGEVTGHKPEEPIGQTAQTGDQT